MSSTITDKTIVPRYSMKLLVAISAHGYGHLAQARAFLWGVRRAYPQFELAVQCDYPAQFIRARVGMKDLEVHALSTDLTIPMRDVLTVDRSALIDLYAADNVINPSAVNACADLYARIGADAVIANVGYWPLAAAQLMGLPNAAYCCLNWAEIIHYYAPSKLRESIDWINEKYNAANAMVRVCPSMPMAGLTNTIDIAPIITPLPDGNLPLADQPKPSADLCVFVSTSDQMLPVHFADFPRINGVHYLINAPSIPTRDDMYAVAADGFDNALAAADIVMTKPGYGMFVECAYRRKNVISINRVDWPEQEYLLRWMRDHARLIEIELGQLTTHTLNNAITTIREQPQPQPFPCGNQDLVRELLNAVGGH